MEKPVHILDQIAIQWNNEEESFFLDTEFSEKYIKVEMPIGKKYAWQVEYHDISKSVNLESLFDAHYRTDADDTFVPLMNRYNRMMREGTFAPAELDLGTVKLYSEAKLTDVVNGIEGGGWIVSKRLFEILKNFNIGEYQPYKIAVKSKKIVSEDYVYLHFPNYADEYVDFPQSVFYKGKGYFDFASRAIMPESFHSAEEIKLLSDQLNEGVTFTNFKKRVNIQSKIIVLKPNELDIFKFKSHLLSREQFISARLAQTLLDEKITGLEFIKTTKVK